MYTIDYSADEPVMMLDTHIGMDEEEGMGIDGSLFAQELLQLDSMGKKRIQVWINSPGGSVIDGMSIYNAILNSKTPVDTYNVGICASMAAVCFMAGRKRYMSDYASMMIHNPFGGDDKKAMDALRESICTMIASRCNCSEEEVGAMMNETTWLNAADCFAKNLCTEIAVTSEANMKRMPASDARAMWKTAKEIVNNAFNNKDNMKKITAKLNLTEGSSEDVIVLAIEGIENKSKAEIEQLKADLAAAEANVKAIQDKLKTTEEDLKAANDKAAAEAAAAAESKAMDMVTNFAKIGRIKNDDATIKSWKALAVADYEGTKKMIEDLPLNKTAGKVEDVKAEGAIEASATAAGVMLAIQNKLEKKNK